MISTKKHVQQLAFLLQAKGITDVVISPGSRNGPAIHTFTLSGVFNCRSIVDERSASYFAIGLALALNKPVALLCSSGTAALNFAPAVAEAFYLNIPLIVLTADRPGYWVNQGENQTILQGNIFSDFCKKEITLPIGESDTELWHAARIINETVNCAMSGLPGPVHINIPLEEPLHDLTEAELTPVKLIDITPFQKVLSNEIVSELALRFDKAKKVLILPGQMHNNPELETTLAKLSQEHGAIVLREHLSNLNHHSFAGHVDLLITSLLNSDIESFRPNLLITFGGSVVSKPLRQFLRKHRPEEHWHLCSTDQYYDTYQSLTRLIQADTVEFLKQLKSQLKSHHNNYHRLWKEKERQIIHTRNEFIKQSDYSDLSVFHMIVRHIPPHSVIHLGNSSPVRYALICDPAIDTSYYSNRGTSGIDGSLSTAAGFASASKKINTIILGDLSFFYDSNSLWNKYIGSNLRIILINNGGGNIFSMIKGPAGSPAFNQFFFTQNNLCAEGIAGTFNIDYLYANNHAELEIELQKLYNPNRNKATILEIFTDANMNSKTFRELFRKVKETVNY